MNRRDFLFARIKNAWRTILGRPAEPETVPIDEVRPEHLAMISKILEEMPALMKQAATTELRYAVRGLHGQLSLPSAGTEEPGHLLLLRTPRCSEEREEIRRRGM